MTEFTHPALTSDHEALRNLVRRFVREKVEPYAPQWEIDGMVPRDVLREMGALGLLGLRFEPEHGGSNLDMVASAVLAEELGRSTFGGFAVTVLVHTDMATPHLHHAGSAAQKARWMPDLIAGRKIAAVAMTEADAGSDLASMRSTARHDGQDWVLNGSKMFITNGVHGDLYFVAAKSGAAGAGPLPSRLAPPRGAASEASVGAVAAGAGPLPSRLTPPQGAASEASVGAVNAGRNRDITMFAIEKGAPGFRVARPLSKHGWLSSDTAELVFDNCRVRADQVLGDEGKGFYALVKNLQNERVVLAAQAMGEAAKAIELTLEWVTQRRAFGATLWDKQVVRQRLAQRAAEIEAVRALIYTAAWRHAQGHNVVREASMLKALAGTLVNGVMYDCVQFHGGMGYMRESTIERMARDARIQSIGGGATEVMLEEVAKRLVPG